MKRAALLFLSFVGLLAGCETGGEFRNVWQEPDYAGDSMKTIGIVALSQTPTSRRFVEETFANALRIHGVHPVTTYGYLPVEQISGGEPAAVQKIRGLGVDAVLSVRLADPETLKTVSVSPQNGGEGVDSWQNWYDFFGVEGAFSTGPDQVRVGNEIGLQAALHDVPDGRLLWSGTVLPTVRGDDSQVREYAEEIAAKLQEAGLIF